jgi:hypothetical protein
MSFMVITITQSSESLTMLVMARKGTESKLSKSMTIEQIDTAYH